MSNRLARSCLGGLLGAGCLLALGAAPGADGYDTGNPAEPRCFLYGSLREVGAPDPKSFAALKHMIRLNLEASDVIECSEAIKRYCRALDPSKYAPSHLRAYFRPPSANAPTHYFEVQATCDLATSTGKGR